MKRDGVFTPLEWAFKQRVYIVGLMLVMQAGPAVAQRLVKHDKDFFALCYSPESVAGHKTQFSGESFLAVVHGSPLALIHPPLG